LESSLSSQLHDIRIFAGNQNVGNIFISDYFLLLRK
jgi:hypothetical protein